MKAEWLKSGILQLKPESTEDVFKLADFVKSLGNDDVNEAPVRAHGEQPALQGLPEYGVLLTGSPKNPIVENHSGKTVIGYVVKFADANGKGSVFNQLMAHSFMQPAGIPDGGSLYAKGAVPLNSSGPRQILAESKGLGQGPIVRAILQSVVFADGQFVGMDEYRTFDLFGKKIKVFTEVGTLAKIGAWDQVEALAQAFAQIPPRIPDGEDHIVFSLQGLAATHLVQARKFKGDAAAGQLTEIYNSLPTLWK